jgi:hypothetical protein
MDIILIPGAYGMIAERLVFVSTEMRAGSETQHEKKPHEQIHADLPAARSETSC